MIGAGGHSGLIKTRRWKRAQWWELNGPGWWSEHNKQQEMVNLLSTNETLCAHGRYDNEQSASAGKTSEYA